MIDQNVKEAAEIGDKDSPSFKLRWEVVPGAEQKEGEALTWITTSNESTAGFYEVTKAPGQLYFMLGFGVIVMAELFSHTQQQQHKDAAQELLQHALAFCSEDILANMMAHKVGLAKSTHACVLQELLLLAASAR